MTAADADAIRHDRANGMSINAIATKYGISKSTAHRWAVGYKRPERHYPPEKRAAAVADYRNTDDGLAAVARRHGISRAALRDWINADDGEALTGGRWVPVNGIQRWEPNKTNAA